MSTGKQSGGSFGVSRTERPRTCLKRDSVGSSGTTLPKNGNFWADFFSNKLREYCSGHQEDVNWQRVFGGSVGLSKVAPVCRGTLSGWGCGSASLAELMAQVQEK